MRVRLQPHRLLIRALRRSSKSVTRFAGLIGVTHLQIPLNINYTNPYPFPNNCPSRPTYQDSRHPQHTFDSANITTIILGQTREWIPTPEWATPQDPEASGAGGTTGREIRKLPTMERPVLSILKSFNDDSPYSLKIGPIANGEAPRRAMTGQATRSHMLEARTSPARPITRKVQQPRSSPPQLTILEAWDRQVRPQLPWTIPKSTWKADRPRERTHGAPPPPSQVGAAVRRGV